MTQRASAIAVATFREAVRDKLLVLVVIFAVALVLFSRVLGWLSVEDELKMVQDFSLSGMSLLSLFLCMLVGASSLAREVERRTVYTVLSRTVRRGDEEAHLTPRELDLLRFLVSREGAAVSRVEILDAVVSLQHFAWLLGELERPGHVGWFLAVEHAADDFSFVHVHMQTLHARLFHIPSIGMRYGRNLYPGANNGTLLLT